MFGSDLRSGGILETQSLSNLVILDVVGVFDGVIHDLDFCVVHEVVKVLAFRHDGGDGVIVRRVVAEDVFEFEDGRNWGTANVEENPKD